MDPKKVRVIFDWPTLENVGEAKSFHGLVSFYRMFMRNFSSIFNVMTKTTRRDKNDFKWTHGAQKIFETLKQRITELPTLALPDFSKVFQVECDASGSEIRAILSQEKRPVAFFSEMLNNAKRKYLVYDQEFYAIVQALKKWRHYLIPKDFVLYTDHKALQYLGSQNKLN